MQRGTTAKKCDTCGEERGCRAVERTRGSRRRRAMAKRVHGIYAAGNAKNRIIHIAKGNMVYTSDRYAERSLEALRESVTAATQPHVAAR